MRPNFVDIRGFRMQKNLFKINMRRKIKVFHSSCAAPVRSNVAFRRDALGWKGATRALK
jgi:hypothetical protein